MITELYRLLYVCGTTTNITLNSVLFENGGYFEEKCLVEWLDFSLRFGQIGQRFYDNMTAESLRKLYGKFYQRKIGFIHKNCKVCIFDPPFGDLGVTHFIYTSLESL